MNHSGHSIDAVVLWVDGNDPVHREKLASYLASIGHKPASADPTRFAETGEFEYCIASLLRFAPWLRKIFIVSDNQTPSFMDNIAGSINRDRIVLVDHRHIFRDYEQYLPTFNSRTLGTVMWRIEGLSERFIYLNDDFVLLRPLSPGELFSKHGIVLRGSWHTQHSHRIDVRLRKMLSISSGRHSGKASSRPGSRAAQAKAAALAGYRKRYFRIPHEPHPLLKSTFSEFLSANPDRMEENLRHPLRSAAQYLPEALGTHLALMGSKARINKRLKTLMLKMDKISEPWLRLRLAIGKRYSRIAFACVQSLDMAGAANRKIVMDFLRRQVGPLSENLNHEYRPQE